MRERRDITNSGQVIEDGDFIGYKSVPCTLAGGHPLRRRWCAICGVLIGGQLIRVIIIVPMTECTCPDTELHSISYLVCAFHQAPDQLEIANAVLDGKPAAPGRLW